MHETDSVEDAIVSDTARMLHAATLGGTKQLQLQQLQQLHDHTQTWRRVGGWHSPQGGVQVGR